MKHDLTACDSKLVYAFPNAQGKHGNAEYVAIGLTSTEQWMNVFEKGRHTNPGASASAVDVLLIVVA